MNWRNFEYFWTRSVTWSGFIDSNPVDSWLESRSWKFSDLQVFEGTFNGRRLIMNKQEKLRSRVRHRRATSLPYAWVMVFHYHEYIFGSDKTMCHFHFSAALVSFPLNLYGAGRWKLPSHSVIGDRSRYVAKSENLPLHPICLLE